MKEEITIVKSRQVQDATLIKKSLSTIKYCTDRLANRIFLIGNLGEKTGRYKPENSLRVVYNILTKKLEQQIVFMDDCIIPNYEQRVENEEIPEGCIIMLENLNFRPEEFGIMEPVPEEKKVIEQEGADEEGSVANRSIAKDEPVEGEAEAEGEEKDITVDKTREEKDHKKEDPTGFKAIDNFRRYFTKYSEIYINDGLEASLTHSNTVAEIKCPTKVMGLRMTEEVRKLGMFFTKTSSDPLVVVLGG
jgi:3-phosphoglycerate kinase